MKVSKNNGYFILDVPAAKKAEVASLMAYRGLAFSTSASTRDKAVLFSPNPYAVADLVEPADCPELAAYRREIDLSRALDGKGTRKLPPGKELWDYQKATLDYLLARGGGIDADQPGLGKRIPVDEPVLTPAGWRNNGDLVAGDFVYGANGILLEIVEVFEPVWSDILRVTFSDGRSVRCDPAHLWEVERVAAGKHYVEVHETKKLLDWGLTYGGGTRNGKMRRNNRFYVPLVKPIQFTEKMFDISPYVLGALIGDGALTLKKVCITTPDTDIEIIERIKNELKDWRLYEAKAVGCSHYSIVSAITTPAFHHKVKALGLNIKSLERFIPEKYMLGSVEQRLDLLRGLMDTDGSCKNNRVTFHTMSPRLAEDVAQLVRSLGGLGKVRRYNRGEKGIEFQVNIRLNLCPFFLSRKARHWRPTNLKLSIKSIEPEGETLQRCIRVADPRGLYVTTGYTLTHNTPTAIAFCNEVEAVRVLVIVPASVRIQWGERIEEWSTIAGLKVSVMLKVKDGINPNANYQVMSYEAARNPAIIKAIAKIKWDVLICDEAHKMKNIEALTTRAVLGNSRGEYQHGDIKTPAIASYCTRKLALTGTLLLNRPSECYVLFRHFDHQSIDFLSEDGFKDKYNKQADMKTIEGKRFKLESTSLESELQNRLRANIMARHEKRDVLPWMKVPRYSIVKVEENGAVKSALDVEGMLGLDIEDIQTTKDFTILGHIAEARRLMGLAMAPQIIAYAMDFLEGSEEKLVIFGWHIDVLSLYEQELSRFGTVRIDGRKNANQRHQAVDDFIKLAHKRVFIGNIQSAGTGLDGLQQVCSRCYLAEPDWVPAQNEQAVSRLDRIGQKDLVNAEIFVAPGSISEKILVRALEKMNVIHRVLDQKEA